MKPHFLTRPRPHGFALVVTLALMVLLSILAVGLLSLSAVALRTSGSAQAEAVARANARMAMMLAIGELQKSIGPDQRITAPSAILDSNPESVAVDGVAHTRLTGVWNARDAANDTLESYNTNPPDYGRDKPNFRRWLVSNAKPEDVEQLNFAKDGTLLNPAVLHGTNDPGLQVRAGKVPVKGGSYAWWVGDENGKAQVNRRDLLAREANPATAELLAGFGSPGAHGIKAVAGFETFGSNSPASDKAITRETVSLTAPAGADTGALFHDVTPYAQSVLASVTGGSLRHDLSLYLERADINWLQDWRNSTWQNGPLGLNGRIALSKLAEYDVLAWKTLHHYYNMHRQVSYEGNRPRVTAIDSTTTTPLHSISNPRINNGVTSINPLILRMQYLISYGLRRVGESKDYELFVDSFPVVTLWNPYNVDMVINGYNIWLHNLPLSHEIFRKPGGAGNNDYVSAGIPMFDWKFGSGTSRGVLCMRFGQPYGVPGAPIVLKAGGQKVFNPRSFGMTNRDNYPAANMAENTDPNTAYTTALPEHAGGRWTSAPNIDRSYAANHLLWDSYYFSSKAPQTGTFYQRFGSSSPLKAGVDDFYNATKPLPNAAYVPHFAGMTAKAVSNSLVNAGGNPLPDSHLKSAAHLMVDGGFNINSTSVPAWTILLASAHLKRHVIMDSEGTGVPAAQSNGNFVVSRFAMPIGGSAGQTSTEESRWRGYRELTVEEIRQLAEAIVRQIKQRGPFRSLGEFMNRRLAGSSDEKALYGALQAALEDPLVDINKDYRNKKITDADIPGTIYAFKEAALGPRFQGTPAYISQADILQSIAPIINARSDTFLIRTYGEALAKDGTTVLARAWCEAVVQRVPEYVNPLGRPEILFTALTQPENRTFGRRLTMKSFRWLTQEEI